MPHFLFLLLLLVASVHSQLAFAAVPPDSVAGTPAHRADAWPWYRPRHLQAQVAGGAGMVAAGAGYEFAKNKLETDVLLGYVPKRYASSTLSLLTLKMLYSPFRVALAKRVQLLPLTVGAYCSYTHGTINDEIRGQYSKNYYWFSTDTRFGPSLGSRLTYLGAPVAATGQPRKISFYYELGSNDLYLVSYYDNPGGGLRITQLLTLALGVKADF